MASTGAEIARAYVTVYAKMPGIENDISRALGGSGVKSALTNGGNAMGAAIAGAVGGAVAAATSKAVNLVMGAIDGAVRRVDTMNAFPKIMKNLGYSASDAEKSIKKMSDRLAGLPTSLDGMSGMVQQLAPLTSGLDEATELSLALNNALLAGGKSTDLQANAMEQYTQMLALGKVDMAAWRSMVSAMPGQMDQLSVSLLGAGNKSMDLYEALKSGEVTFDDFNQAVMKLNKEGTGNFASFEKQARDSTDGIGTGWANLQTAITRNLANIIQKLKPAIDAFLVGSTAIANALGPVMLGVIDIAIATSQWAEANRDWLIPAGIIVGTITGIIVAINVFKAAQLAWAAAMGAAQIATFLTGNSLSIYNGILKAQTIATNVAAGAKRAFDLVMSAGPIGLVLTAVTALVAGLVYFFTSTKTGKKMWGEFTRFLGEAWANVSSFFVTVYEQYLKPVFDGIATVATWVFENILQPLFLGAQIYFSILGGIFMGVWEYVLRPIFEALGAIFGWIYNTIIVPIIDAIIIYVKVWAAIFTWLWKNVLSPIFGFIGAIFKWIYETIIIPIINGIKVYIEVWAAIFTWLWQNAIKPAIDGIAWVFTWLWENVIKPVWDGISGTIKTVWEKGIKPIIDTLSKVIQTDPKKAFEAARDAIGDAWAGIQDLAKKPVRFVIETVINGLISTINKIPGVNIPKVPLPAGFSAGGYTGNLPTTAVAGVVHGDEHVIRAASRRAIEATNPGLLDHLNRTGKLPGYAKGGLVHPMPGAVVTEEYGGYPGHRGIDLAKPMGTPILAAASGAVDFSGWYGGGGWMAGLNHGGGLGTRYKHMMSPPIVGVGQMVKQKQVIGYEGSTGDSTGPHLHYEVLVNGNRINPRPYLDGAGDAGILDLFGGLKDLLKGQFTKAFPGSDMWIDAAWGVAGSGIDAAINWGKSMLPWGGGDPLLYDNGGWLNPGTHLVENRSGRPEPILTSAQWGALTESRGGFEQGTRVYIVLEDGRELAAYVDERADGVVTDAFGSASAGSLASRLGGRRG